MSRLITSKTVTAPFTVVIDNREQLPYAFNAISAGGKAVIVPVERGTLTSGDYSICSFQERIKR